MRDYCVRGAAIAGLLILILPNLALAANSPASQPKSSRPTTGAAATGFRTWTDEAGKLSAEAALLNVEGDTVRLRKSNGKLAVIKIDKLSRADQQYVAQRKQASQARKPATRAQATAASAPAKPAAAPGSWLDNFKLPGFGAKPNDADASSAYLLYARVSRDLIENYAGGTVDSQTPVTDNILGTNFYGTARTRGQAKLVLRPNDKQAVAELVFFANVNSATTGYNGPIITHNVAQTQVETRKVIALGNAGVRSSPCSSSAHTSSQTLGLEACMGGLKGRIAQRIAWRTVDSLRPQADEIVSQHTAENVERTLDSQFSSIASAVRAVLENDVRTLPYDKDKTAPRLRFRSMPEFVDVTMYRSEGTPKERKLAPPAIDGRPQIALRVHQSVVARALLDPKLQEILKPLFDGLRPNSAEQKTKLADRPALQLRWSPDRAWLMLDYNGQSPPLKERTAQQQRNTRQTVAQ